MAMTKAKPSGGSTAKAAVAKAPASKASGNAATATDAEKANIPPATEFAPSGAPIQTSGEIDTSHPAVDADPRAETTTDQNRIDFNDPSKSGSQAVEDNLKAKD